MATDAFVYDALRTPRGKGKKNGTLHEVKPVDLVVTLLEEVRKRHDGFHAVGDVREQEHAHAR